MEALSAAIGLDLAARGLAEDERVRGAAAPEERR